MYKEPFLTIIPLFLGFGSIYLNRLVLANSFKNITSHKRKLLVLVISFFVLILAKVFPDIGFDSNWYHLSQPLYYLKYGGIYHVGGYIFSSGYPQFTEMLFIPLLHWGNSITTSLFSLFNYLLLGVVVYKLVTFLTEKSKWALVAAIAVLTTPIIFLYAGFAYVDISQGLAFTLAFYWMLTYFQTKDLKDIVIGALMLIPVVAIKYSGGLLCVALAGYVLASEIGLFQKIKTLFILGVFPILGLIPWLIRNKIEMDNFLDPMGKIKMFHYGSDAPNYWEYLKNINWLNTLSVLHSEKLLDYLIPFSIIVIFIYYLKNKKWNYLVFVIVSLVIYRIMPPGNHYRFFIPFIPIVIVLATTALSEVKNKYLSLSFRFIFGAFLVIQMYNCVLQAAPFTAFALGLKDTQQFKNYFFVKEPFMFYDPSGKVKVEVGTKKLIVKGVDLIFPTLEEFKAKDYSFADINRQEIYSFKTLRTEMVKNDYNYILVNRGTLQEHFSIWFKENETDQVNSYFDLILHEKTQYGKEWFLYKTK